MKGTADGAVSAGEATFWRELTDAAAEALRAVEAANAEAWKRAAEALARRFPAVMTCIPKGRTSGELRSFRQAWGVDDGHGKASGVVASAWVAWEFFGLGVWLRNQVDSETHDELARMVSWRRRLTSYYWSDFLAAATEARCEAFDTLAGGDASHDTPPALDPAMRSAEPDLLVEIGDRWLRRLDWIEAQERAAGGLPGATDPEGKVDRARWEIRALKSHMLADLKALVRFETNPAHWEPTPAQLARLPPAWRRCFELKAELATCVGFGSSPPNGVADAREALAQLRAEMAAARPRG